MIEVINKATKTGINIFGDSATKKFYEELKAHKFKTTKCKNCQKLFFPPKEFCSECLDKEVEWIELSGKAKLYAFTQQERATRFSKPDVIGIVELQEGFLLLTRILGELGELKIGMEMQISFLDISSDLALHQFLPVGGQIVSRKPSNY